MMAANSCPEKNPKPQKPPKKGQYSRKTMKPWPACHQCPQYESAIHLSVLSQTPKAVPCHQMRIGHHTLPQQGFSLSTPRGTEGGGATPGNTGRGRNERGRKQQLTRRTAHGRTLACTASSVTDASTNTLKKKTTWGPRLTPRGLRPQQPKRGGTRGRQRPATRDAGGSARGHRERCASAAVNTRAPTGCQRVFRDRRSHQQNISGNNGTHSSTQGARTALQEEKRIQEPGARSQEPGHAMSANGTHKERFHVKRQTHARARRRLGRQKVQEVGPEISRWYKVRCKNQALVGSMFQ
jgi:hypothetical protein